MNCVGHDCQKNCSYLTFQDTFFNGVLNPIKFQHKSIKIKAWLLQGINKSKLYSTPFLCVHRWSIATLGIGSRGSALIRHFLMMQRAVDGRNAKYVKNGTSSASLLSSGAWLGMSTIKSVESQRWCGMFFEWKTTLSIKWLALGRL